jgi:hypothetical protein
VPELPKNRRARLHPRDLCRGMEDAG